jgi:RimJ/RimL family protein N-acetyltransferase
MAEAIPHATIDALARSIYKEASTYGFQQVDIIRLINELMDLCTDSDGSNGSPTDGGRLSANFISGEISDLPLSGERVLIRKFDEENDRRLLEQWLPDRYGRYFVLSCATAQSITIDALTDSPNNHLGIVTLHDGRPIGAMAYLDHSREQRRAELRKLIGDLDARGQGFAEEATRLWIGYGARALGLEKIYVSTLQTQLANIKLNEHVGFRVEGLLHNEVLIDGERHDVLRMGLILAK